MLPFFQLVSIDVKCCDNPRTRKLLRKVDDFFTPQGFFTLPPGFGCRPLECRLYTRSDLFISAALHAGYGALQHSSDSPERDILRDKYEICDRRVGALASYPRGSKDIDSAILPN
jgi:hypothetical protein